MKVHELKALIERWDETNEVVIPIETLGVTIGGQPYLKVKGIYSGFDWDHGKVFVTPEYPVHEADIVYRAEQKLSRNRGEALAFIWMSVTNKNLNEKQKLDAVRNTLRRFGFAHGLKEEE